MRRQMAGAPGVGCPLGGNRLVTARVLTVFSPGWFFLVGHQPGEPTPASVTVCGGPFCDLVFEQVFEAGCGSFPISRGGPGLCGWVGVVGFVMCGVVWFAAVRLLWWWYWVCRSPRRRRH